MLFFQNLYSRFSIFLSTAMTPDLEPARQAAGGEPTGAAPEAMGGGGILPMVLIWGGMFVALYFFLIRPQRKRDRAAKEMQGSLKVGDRVVTSSGMYGKIVSVGKDAFMIEFGDVRGIRIPVNRANVMGVKTPDMSPVGSEPAALEEKKEEKKEN